MQSQSTHAQHKTQRNMRVPACAPATATTAALAAAAAASAQWVQLVGTNNAEGHAGGNRSTTHNAAAHEQHSSNHVRAVASQPHESRHPTKAPTSQRRATRASRCARAHHSSANAARPSIVHSQGRCQPASAPAPLNQLCVCCHTPAGSQTAHSPANHVDRLKTLQRHLAMHAWAAAAKQRQQRQPIRPAAVGRCPTAAPRGPRCRRPA